MIKEKLWHLVTSFSLLIRDNICDFQKQDLVHFDQRSGASVFDVPTTSSWSTAKPLW